MRFQCSIFLNAVLCVAEFVVGFMAQSLTLQVDAVHMLSDVLALVMAWYAEKKTNSPSPPSATYGTARYVIIGALVNTVFLLSSCL